MKKKIKNSCFHYDFRTIRLLEQRAFTILELLVTLVLTALVILGAMRVYHSVTRTLRIEQAYTQMQEAGRFTYNLLRREVKQAGDASCVAPKNPLQSNAVQIYAVAQAPSWLKNQAKKMSEILVLASCQQYKGKLQFVQTAYYVGDTKRKNVFGNKVYALYSKIKGSRRVEQMPGVSNLQLQLDGKLVDFAVELTAHASKIHKNWSFSVNSRQDA